MTRLITIILLFLLSLLAVLRGQAYYLWLLSIAVTEFPLIFAFGTIVMLITGFWVNKYQLSGTIIGVVALILFVSPIFRSYLIARNLKQDLAYWFGDEKIKNDIDPLALGKLFTLKFKDTVQHQTLNYVTYADGAKMTLDFAENKNTLVNLYSK